MRRSRVVAVVGSAALVVGLVVGCSARDSAPEPAPDVPVLKIAQMQQTRFQASDDYDEMRVLNIGLSPAHPGTRMDRDAVQVEVIFYDRDPESGAVEPTEAKVSQETTEPTAAWGHDTEKLVSATYLVPTDLRAAQQPCFHRHSPCHTPAGTG